jgi:membrane protein DedA with SNARE-associated domain
MNEYVDVFISTVQSVHPGIRNLLAGLAIMLETTILLGLVIPGDTIVLVASTGVLDWGDFAWLLMAVLLGSLFGESIGYSIGYWLGPKIRNTRLGKAIGQRRWDRAEKFVARRGGVAVFISRFLPVLHSVVPAVAGATKMPYKVFIAWTFAACTIWTSLYVGVGFLARESYELLSENLRFGSFVAIAILLVALGLIALGKKLLEKFSDRISD